MTTEKLTPRAKKLLAIFRANADLPTLELANKSGLTVQSVYRWRGRLRPHLSSDASPFIEFTPPRQSSIVNSPPPLQVLVNDLKVEVPSDFNAEFLCRVLKELRKC